MRLLHLLFLLAVTSATLSQSEPVPADTRFVLNDFIYHDTNGLNQLPEPPVLTHEADLGNGYSVEWLRSVNEGEQSTHPNDYRGTLVRVSGPGAQEYVIRDHYVEYGLTDEDTVQLEDVTGNGIPNLVVSTWDGGRSAGKYILELGDELRIVAALPSHAFRFAVLRLEDLDGDGRHELVAMDGTHAYQYGCSGAASSYPWVVFEYESELGYVLASPTYYAAAIDSHGSWSYDFSLASMIEWFEHQSGWLHNRDAEGYWYQACDAMQAVLDLVYAGHWSLAREMFDQLFPEDPHGTQPVKGPLLESLYEFKASYPLVMEASDASSRAFGSMSPSVTEFQVIRMEGLSAFRQLADTVVTSVAGDNGLVAVDNGALQAFISERVPAWRAVFDHGDYVIVCFRLSGPAYVRIIDNPPRGGSHQLFPNEGAARVEDDGLYCAGHQDSSAQFHADEESGVGFGILSMYASPTVGSLGSGPAFSAYLLRQGDETGTPLESPFHPADPRSVAETELPGQVRSLDVACLSETIEVTYLQHIALTEAATLTVANHDARPCEESGLIPAEQLYLLHGSQVPLRFPIRCHPDDNISITVLESERPVFALNASCLVLIGEASHLLRPAEQQDGGWEESL